LYRLFTHLQTFHDKNEPYILSNYWVNNGVLGIWFCFATININTIILTESWSALSFKQTSKSMVTDCYWLFLHVYNCNAHYIPQIKFTGELLQFFVGINLNRLFNFIWKKYNTYIHVHIHLLTIIAAVTTCFSVSFKWHTGGLSGTTL